MAISIHDVRYPRSGVATGATLTAGKFVQVSGTGGYPNTPIQIAADADAVVIGVTLEGITQNDSGSIACMPGDVVPMVAGAAGVTAGALVTAEAGATGLPINSAGTKKPCGVCLLTAVGGATTYIQLGTPSYQ